MTQPLKISVVGGGPGGLYFAILMKKADPRHAITVYERNRPDDTFGFGVVFSDETLDNIQNADPETFDAIARHFSAVHPEKTAEPIRDRVLNGITPEFCAATPRTTAAWRLKNRA